MASQSSDTSVENSDSGSDVDEDIDPEPILFESVANPSETKEYCWIYSLPPKRLRDDDVLGKWLLFRPFSQIDETWHMIRKEMKNGSLTESTRGAKCSCLYYNPSCGGPGPKTSGVICIYTTERDVDKAGFILIDMVKHDIKYKTDEATLGGEYAWKGGGKSVCLKTLYWNGGKPSFMLEGVQFHGPRCYGIKDVWHLNCVTAPKSIMNSYTIYGRWVIVTESDWELTGLWHALRKVIEKGKWGPVEMFCPPKVNRKDPKEEIVFFLYTACDNKEFVGRSLAFLEKDITYEVSQRALNYCSRYKPVYDHRIMWNDDDEPVYVMTINRK